VAGPDVPQQDLPDQRWDALTGDLALRRAEADENFPVALRLLPRGPRTHLRAVYDVVRVIDDLGDEAAGSRTALLEAFAQDIERVWDREQPQTDVLRRLVPTVDACGLSAEPFQRLVQANLQDQRVDRYATWQDLRGYCALSADPIGRIVLHIFAASSPERVALSDRVCTALQLLEHCQDVAEDRARGRIYLPQEDLERFGVRPAHLDATRSTPELRAVIAFETNRAARLLADGSPLVGSLRGWARLAVAGYLAGGLAVVDALRRPQADVLAHTPKPRRPDVLRHLVVLLVTAGRHGAPGRSQA
jgi:squalene synthase HpnC